VTAPAQSTVTIQTSPAGRQIAVGGVTQNTPYYWTCSSGSIAVGVSSPQSGGTGTQYVYGSWSDGGTQTHSINCPASNTTYTASFTTQYLLTMTAGSGGSVSPANGWYNAGQGVGILATQNQGESFTGWTGSGSGSYSGTSQSATATMNGPLGETAAFSAPPPLTITTGPTLPTGYLSVPYCSDRPCQIAQGSGPYFHFTATGGTGSYTWTETNILPLPYQALPEGLTLSSAGVLSGTIVPESGGYPFTTTTTLAGTYKFTVTVTDGAGHQASLNVTVTFLVPQVLSSLAALQDCIGPSGAVMGHGMICELASGAYNVGPTAYSYGSTNTVAFTDSYGRLQHQLVIGRSGNSSGNLVITGTPVSGGAADTVLRRGDPTQYLAAWDSAIMTTAGTAASTTCDFCPSSSSLPITGVTVEYLTFDGNRYDSYGASGQPLHCQSAQLQYIDLYLGPNGASQNGIFTVQSDDFINSPDTAFLLSGTGSSQPAAASTVSFSNFGQGGYGIGPTGGQPGSEMQDATATRFTAMYIEGTYTGAYYNNAAYAGTSGLTLDKDFNSQGIYQTVYGNQFTNNRYEGSDGISGSQVAMYPATSWGTFAGNVIDGNNWEVPANGTTNGCSTTFQYVAGIEVNGTGHRFYNNEVTNHTGGGMAIGTQPAPGQPFTTGQIVVSAYNPWDPNDAPRLIENNGSDGIVVYGGYRCALCNPADLTFDQVKGLILDTLQIRNNKGYAVSLYYSLNYTDINNKMYYGFSQENPDGTQSQAYMCGNGTVLYNRDCGSGSQPVPGSQSGTVGNNDVHWCSNVVPIQPTFYFPSSYNPPVPPATCVVNGNPGPPAPSGMYPIWKW
jgi:hypothetical protein